MLRIRALIPDDLARIQELHDRYYSQFEFPKFFDKSYLNAFVIDDEGEDIDKSIVMAGAVEKVAEITLVTNKQKSRIKIGKALVEAQKCSTYTCAINNIRDMYAFVDDDEYAKHLKQHGFIDVDRALRFRIT